MNGGLKNHSLTGFKGLSTAEATTAQLKYGKNFLSGHQQNRFWLILKDVALEPMFLLLSAACLLYFILGSTAEGIMMLVAISIVTAISIFQEVRSSKALENLKSYTAPSVKLIRDGHEKLLPTEELVPGDIILLEEGEQVPADAVVLQSNDLSVNESIITGESVPADKDLSQGNIKLFQGTTVNSGKCVAQVTFTGNNTELGKIGKAMTGQASPKTLLQLQMAKFVKRLSLFGLLGFILVFAVNFSATHQLVASLLFALTLAMSAIPEEIPVAFSSFMALGAYKMSQLGIISRQPQVIENIGSVSVLCLDKTGTLTENNMQVKQVYDNATSTVIQIEKENGVALQPVLWYALLASETDPFDPMEKAIEEACALAYGGKLPVRTAMIHEYPLGGKPPMMTHIYQEGNETVAAAKGAAEKIIEVCKLSDEHSAKILNHALLMAGNGYRVLGVAKAAVHDKNFPASQEDFNWQFLGLVALYDPPKKNIKNVLLSLRDAGIDLKMLTGDFVVTAKKIAEETGIPFTDTMTGEEVMNAAPEVLKERVNKTSVFARMFPEAKVKVIETLKASGAIVAMTGDGVNDGPALKIADVGITLGKKGTETAKAAADLIITDDNLKRITDAVIEGRKIYANLLKAIRYIISIHIPIILVASLPLVLGWRFPNIFTPIHVIFLELIMGPTCSIFFEREPAESNVLENAPRKRKADLFSMNELMISVAQGLMITAAVLSVYFVYMNRGEDIQLVRTVVFTTLIISNVWLTFTERSFTRTIFSTIRYKNNLALPLLLLSALFLVLLLLVPGVRNLFQLTAISFNDFFICAGAATIGVLWFEVYKAIRYGFKR
jgi:Ca2+-transporting ATPase